MRRQCLQLDSFHLPKPFSVPLVINVRIPRKVTSLQFLILIMEQCKLDNFIYYHRSYFNVIKRISIFQQLQSTLLVSYHRLNEIYSDVTNAISSNVKPADIGSVYRVYQDFTTLRTLANDYMGEDASSKGKKTRNAHYFNDINHTIFIHLKIF